MLSRSTSFDVREQTGLNLKSALRHILSIDLRDDLIFPSHGSLFQVTSELAGLGGDVGFVKNEAFVQGNYSLYEDYVSEILLLDSTFVFYKLVFGKIQILQQGYKDKSIQKNLILHRKEL